MQNICEATLNATDHIPRPPNTCTKLVKLHKDFHHRSPLKTHMLQAGKKSKLAILLSS